VLAIDTNLIVRYLTGDHPRQSARARAVIDGEDVFVGVSVLLETAWVLRSVYRYADRSLVEALRAFVGLPRVTVENPGSIAQALAWTDAGMDFADALHLASARNCEAFVTFDQGLTKTAHRVGAGQVRMP
jgi:predicted nucleic acid-binding protein